MPKIIWSCGMGVVTVTRQKITSFAKMGVIPDLKQLYAQHNLVSDISTLQTQPKLSELHLEGNTLSDLKGAKPQPMLSAINVSNTPLMTKSGWRLALLLCYPTLRRINGDNVSLSLKKISHDLGTRAYKAVLDGWVPETANKRPKTSPDKGSKTRLLTLEEAEASLKAYIDHSEEPAAADDAVMNGDEDRVRHYEELLGLAREEIKSMKLEVQAAELATTDALDACDTYRTQLGIERLARKDAERRAALFKTQLEKKEKKKDENEEGEEIEISIGDILIVQWDYDAHQDDELSVNEGEEVEVVQLFKGEFREWTQVTRTDGSTGILPISFLGSK